MSFARMTQQCWAELHFARHALEHGACAFDRSCKAVVGKEITAMHADMQGVIRSSGWDVRFGLVFCNSHCKQFMGSVSTIFSFQSECTVRCPWELAM